MTDGEGSLNYETRRFIEGKPEGQPPPVVLPPTPWTKAVVEEAVVAVPKITRPSKYGLENLVVGKTVTVPYKWEVQGTVLRRMKAYLLKRSYRLPDRFILSLGKTGVRVTRVK